MTEPIPARDLVTRTVAALAQALDRDDFGAAARLIAPDCVYEIRASTIAGTPAIVASYADASAWGRRHFDEVRYESAVETPDGATAAVTFTDYLLKAGGRWHRHRCRQAFTVNAAGLVVRIVHHDLPGERETLDAYFRECGVER
jgi:hypothetical protein